MDTTLTQRIVGAIVILSLAIIFIPALLESDQIDSGQGIVSPIPEVPREISTIIFELNESTGKFEQSSKQLKQQVADAFIAAEDEREIINAQEDTVELVAGAVPDNLTVESGNSELKKPLVTDTPARAHSWLVQVASFKDKSKALGTRDKLRQMKYVARLNQRELSAGSIWRVRVGPFDSKDRARSIMLEIEQETGMAGLIIRRR